MKSTHYSNKQCTTLCSREHGSRRITDTGKFQTFSGKFIIKAKPLNQFNWIKFRGPILIVWSSLQSFSFVCLPSCSQSAGKIFPLEPHSEATRNFPGPKKNPRAYFEIYGNLTKDSYKTSNKCYNKILCSYLNTRVQSINNVFCIVNKVENVYVFQYNLIDNVAYVFYALYSKISPIYKWCHGKNTLLMRFLIDAK